MSLPVPARFIIDTRGFIRYAGVSPDDTARPEPAHTIAALGKLQNARHSVFMKRHRDKFHRGRLGAATRFRAGLASALAATAMAMVLWACNPSAYRRDADRVARDIIDTQQRQALGQTEPLTIDHPEDALRKKLLLSQRLPNAGPAAFGVRALPSVQHWPEPLHPPPDDARDAPAAETDPEEPLRLTLAEALQVAAANNREYMTNKENVFLTALDLDLERNEYRGTLAGTLDGLFSTNTFEDAAVSAVEGTADASVGRRFQRGGAAVGMIFLDLVKLLTADRRSAFGIAADASISIPLLGGAGKHVVTEPLTQAERNVTYALYALERFKSTLAVQVAEGYLAVLNQGDQLKNAENNLRQLKLSVGRARRLAEAGRLPNIQVDQAVQDELRAQDRVLAAGQQHAQLNDAFKLLLGLPTDAWIELDPSELDRLAAAVDMKTHESGDRAPAASEAPTGIQVAPLVDFTFSDDMDSVEAIIVAFENRLDLRILKERVVDAQRRVVVAADALKAGLNLEGSAQVGERRNIGSADLGNARFRLDSARYTAGARLDLPLERTAERNAYRESFIDLERAVREVQDLDDRIKLELRDELRTLQRARESLRIQWTAIQLAEKRIRSTELFLQAGRAEIRDLLEAQESLISAQNAYTSALVNYRVAQLQLQRDMGILEVDHRGLWNAYAKTP